MKKSLYAEEMIPISQTWLDPTSKSNLIITSRPLLTVLLPTIQGAHDLVMKEAQPDGDPEIKEIIKKEAKLDARHDRILRHGFGYLTATAELLDGDAGLLIIKLRDLLFPDGPSGQNKTYRGEAGAAVLLDKRMTPEVRTQTDGFVIGSGANAQTLTVYLDELIGVGKDLGKLEDRRDQLEAQTPAADLYEAQLSWVGAANALEANAELAKLTPEEDKILFGPLREEEKKADERALQKAKAKAKKEKAEGEDGQNASPGAAPQAPAPTGPQTPSPTGP